MTALLDQIDEFLKQTGLSEHRAGILLAKNGRLIPRLRRGGRVWPETAIQIQDAIREELDRRSSEVARVSAGAVDVSKMSEGDEAA